MEIQHDDDGKKGVFYVSRDGRKVASMVYTWAGDDRFIIEHTEVDESLKGQGAGKQMLVKAVEFARARKVKIIPLCPFARSVFNKQEELRDVL
jgi:predicted GNAT family acetyltransferase